MLGIRQHHGSAIDLWQGDVRSFVCDVAVIFYSGDPDALPLGNPRLFAGLPPGEAMLLPGQDSGYPASHVVAVYYPSIIGMDDRANLGTVLNSFTNALHLVGELGVRHVALRPPQSSELGDLYGSLAMVAIKSFLDEQAAKKNAGASRLQPARWTMVLDCLETYDSFQAQLFAAFPETP